MPDRNGKIFYTSITSLSHINKSAGYTSNSSKSPNVNYRVQVDLGTSVEFDRINLYPKTNAFSDSGATASFPKDFTIEVSDTANGTYTKIAEFKDYEAPYITPAVIDIPKITTARYVRLKVTKVGAPPTGEDYYLQLAELGVYRINDNNVDFDNLKNLLDSASKHNKNDYTPESWASFESALKDAENVYLSSSASQPEVDKIYTNLLNAVNSLKKASSSPNPSPAPNPDDNKPQPSAPSNGIKDGILYVNGKAVTGSRVQKIGNTAYAVVNGKVATGSKTRVVTVGSYKYIVTKNGTVTMPKKRSVKTVSGKSYVVGTNGRIMLSKKQNKLYKAGTKSYVVRKRTGEIIKS